MRKSWENHEKVIRKSWECYEKVKRKSWESQWTVMRISWEIHEKVARKLLESCQKVARMFPENCQKIARKFPKGCQKVARKSFDSHETVYYSTPVADLADTFVLVCSVRGLSVIFQQGGHMTMACLSGKSHGKKIHFQKSLLILIIFKTSEILGAKYFGHPTSKGKKPLKLGSIATWNFFPENCRHFF